VSLGKTVEDAVFSESSLGVRAQDEARHVRVLDTTAVDQAPGSMLTPGKASMSSSVCAEIVSIKTVGVEVFPHRKITARSSKVVAEVNHPFVAANVSALEAGIQGASSALSDPFFGVKLPAIDASFLHTFEIKCIEEFTIGNRIAEAREACKDFLIDESDLDKEFAELQRSGSVKALIKMRHEQRDASEFNLKRLHTTLSEIPAVDYERLSIIAARGCDIVEPASFERLHEPEPMRKLSQHLGNCMQWHAHNLFSKGKALMFRLSDLREGGFLPELNFSTEAHWVFKPGTAQGRFVLDSSSSSHGRIPLNSVDSLDVIKANLGEMVLPQIKYLTRRWYALAKSKGVSLSALSLWKEDIKNAFGQQKVCPEGAVLLAVRMGPDLVVILMYGGFGYNGQPYAYNVLGKSMNLVLESRIEGIADAYVDDTIGCALDKDASSDQAIAQILFAEVLGESSTDEKKSTKPAKVADIIGWTVDFIKETLRPNDKGIRKLFFVFFTQVDLSAKALWPLKLRQTMASLSERYSQGVIGMDPFVHPLNESTRGGGVRKPSSAARHAVVMWRAMTLMLVFNPDALAAPLSSLLELTSSDADFYFISDAYNSVGLKIFDKQGVLVAWASYKFPFHAPESDHQNAKEFLGLVVCLIVIRVVLKAGRGTSLYWRGDNMAALSWANDGKARSTTAQAAFTAFSWIVIKSGFRLVPADHIAGASEEMKDCDDLSRERVVPSLDSRLEVKLSEIAGVDDLFQLCSPLTDRTMLQEHSVLLEQLSALINRIF